MTRRPGVPGTTRFGRRTLVLLHCGVTWILTGWAILSLPGGRFFGPAGPLRLLDSPYLGYVWIVGGTLAVVNAPLRRRFHGYDVPGFLGLVTPPVIWLISYIVSALTYLLTHGAIGNQRAGLGIVTWYLVSVFVLIVAGWPDPDDPTVRPRLPDGPVHGP